ncbi:MAG: hypothetical protein V1703_02910 [Candidatus Altiarchaeota archaeon]
MTELLAKVNRITGWLSLLFLAVFTLTGFAMVGMWRMDEVIGVRRASWLHSTPYMIYPMIIVALVHSILCAWRYLLKWTKRK